jgi:hypothetical protein
MSLLGAPCPPQVRASELHSGSMKDIVRQGKYAGIHYLVCVCAGCAGCQGVGVSGCQGVRVWARAGAKTRKPTVSTCPVPRTWCPPACALRWPGMPSRGPPAAMAADWDVQCCPACLHRCACRWGWTATCCMCPRWPQCSSAPRWVRGGCGGRGGRPPHRRSASWRPTCGPPAAMLPAALFSRKHAFHLHLPVLAPWSTNCGWPLHAGHAPQAETAPGGSRSR